MGKKKKYYLERLKELGNGFKFELGILVESLGEMWLMVIAVIVALSINGGNIQNLFSLRSDLLILILVFIGIHLRRMGLDIQDVAFRKKNEK